MPAGKRKTCARNIENPLHSTLPIFSIISLKLYHKSYSVAVPRNTNTNPKIRKETFGTYVATKYAAKTARNGKNAYRYRVSTIIGITARGRSEERRVGKECRSRWS